MFHIFTHVILTIFIYAKSSQWSSKICLVCLRKQNTLIVKREYICSSSLLLLFLATTLGIFYVRPYTHLLGSSVTAGTAIGTHISVHCAYRTCMTDHVHFVKYVNGQKVNPTYEYGNI